MASFTFQHVRHHLVVYFLFCFIFYSIDSFKRWKNREKGIINQLFGLMLADYDCLFLYNEKNDGKQLDWERQEIRKSRWPPFCGDGHWNKPEEWKHVTTSFNFVQSSGKPFTVRSFHFLTGHGIYISTKQKPVWLFFWHKIEKCKKEKKKKKFNHRIRFAVFNRKPRPTKNERWQTNGTFKWIVGVTQCKKTSVFAYRYTKFKWLAEARHHIFIGIYMMG